MFNPQPNDENTRVYRATIIDYVTIEPQPGYMVPTMRVKIEDILYGLDDLPTDTLILVGQDGLNCATEMPIAYDGEIIFLAEFIFQDGEYFYDVGGAGAELSDCGPSYLNVSEGQVFGPIGGNLTSGSTLIEFVKNLDEMGNCALSVHVEEPALNEAEVQIYPIPATDRVFIYLTDLNSSLTELNVSLVTTTGKIVRRQSFLNAARLVDLDVTKLPTGFYFLRIMTDVGEVTKRIVIN